MLRFLLFWSVLFSLVSCSGLVETEVMVRVKGAQAGGRITLASADSSYVATTDSTGTARFVLDPEDADDYASVKFNEVNQLIFVPEHKKVEVSFEFPEGKKHVSFAGETAEINNYLNADPFRNMSVDYALSEDDFIASLAESEQILFNRLTSCSFDEKFTSIEKSRIHYVVYGYLGQYSSYHSYYARVSGYKPTEKFLNVLKEQVRENDSLFGMTEYHNAWMAMIQTFAERQVSRYQVEDYINCELEFILANIRNPLMIERYIHIIMYDYVDRFGIRHLDRFKDTYYKNVQSEARKSAFSKVCQKWEKISEGRLSPDFSCTDMDGKPVSLKDLRGKYLYIDVWATWCGPCRGQLPYLKELEKRFRNANIEFVSISCDDNVEDWKAMVRKQELKGVQLILGKDRQFMTDYVIKGIPRFILLDKEGKIISSYMTSPSKEKTIETLNALPDIR